MKSALLESIEETIDNKITGKISYNIDWSLIAFHLSQGHSVIFDSPCLYDEMIKKGEALTEKFQVKYKYIECYLDDFEEINDRLKNRESLISQITEAKSEKAFYYTIDNSKKPNDINCLVVDTGQPITSYLQTVLDYIKE